jgi:hypothetical protein
MASLTHKGKLVIASAEIDAELKSWKIHLVIGWHLISDQKFATKKEAEEAGLEIAKEFIDRTMTPITPVTPSRVKVH